MSVSRLDPIRNSVFATLSADIHLHGVDHYAVFRLADKIARRVFPLTETLPETPPSYLSMVEPTTDDWGRDVEGIAL